VKAKTKDNSLPDGVSCDLSAQTVTISNAQDGFFTDKLDVYHRNLLIGTCGREQPVCVFSFSN
jgi:hypothetical protein